MEPKGPFYGIEKPFEAKTFVCTHRFVKLAHLLLHVPFSQWKWHTLGSSRVYLQRGDVDVCRGMMGFNARQAVGPELRSKNIQA